VFIAYFKDILFAFLDFGVEVTLTGISDKCPLDSKSLLGLIRPSEGNKVFLAMIVCFKVFDILFKGIDDIIDDGRCG
jgi:hypothetical protein